MELLETKTRKNGLTPESGKRLTFISNWHKINLLMATNFRAFIVSIKIIKWGLILPVPAGLLVGMINRSRNMDSAMVGAWTGLAILSFLGLATFVMLLLYSHFRPGIDSSSSMRDISKFTKASKKAFLATLVFSIPVGWFISCAVWGATEEGWAGLYFCIPSVFFLGFITGVVLSIFSASEIINSDGKIGGIKKTLNMLLCYLVPVLGMVVFVGWIWSRS